MLKIEFEEGKVDCDLFPLMNQISSVCKIKDELVINTENDSSVSYDIFKSSFSDLFDIFDTIHKINFIFLHEVLSEHTTELENMYYNKFWYCEVPEEKLVERLLHISKAYIDLDIDTGVANRDDIYWKYYINSLIINDTKYPNMGVCDTGSNHLSELNITNGSMDKYSDFMCDVRIY